jgi:hypothetical protein
LSLNRDLQEEHIQLILSSFPNQLIGKLKKSHIVILGKKINHLEACLIGRFATNIEDLIFRCLTMRLIPGENIRLTEIGALFGISALAMHSYADQMGKIITTQVIDPLEGYYNSGIIDGMTGIPVNKRNLSKNISKMGLTDDEFDILQGLSNNDDIKSIAHKRNYNYLSIDGDHSFDGVKYDFENYAGHLCKDGILLIDDYNSKDWPDVTKFVNEIVKEDERFDFVTQFSRSIVFKKISNILE